MQTAQLSTILMVVLIVMYIRMRKLKKPIKGSGLRLIWPLLFFLPVTMMFFNPELNLTTWEVVGAVGLGLVFSVPLIYTTDYERREDGLIYAKPNKAFLYALVGLVIVRFALRNYLSDIDPQTLGALFVLVALSYVIPWRVVSYRKFRKVYLDTQKSSLSL